MEFRPCIDIHNGKVKQIIGSSLSDAGDRAKENFVSERTAADFAALYKKKGLRGGHVILLNAASSPFYEETKAQAIEALDTYPLGLQIGGGITDLNASEFLEAGASHVIVTSFVFSDGRIQRERLESLRAAVGREHIVLDLSCRRRPDGDYYVTTDRWQRLTKERVNIALLEQLSSYADEFLIHGVDVEGKANGFERELVQLLGDYEGIPVTYAGGIRSFSDIDQLYELGRGRVHATIGSALDLFGGPLDFEEVCQYFNHI